MLPSTTLTRKVSLMKKKMLNYVFTTYKNREGKVYELFKPLEWLEKVQMDSYVSKLNEKKALIDAIYINHA